MTAPAPASPIPSLANDPRVASALIGVREREQERFAGVLARAQARGPEEARKAAEQLVSTALVQPVLAITRESTMAAPPFAPSAGERMFRSLQDTALAERLVASSRWPLVDTLTQKLSARTAALAPAAAPVTAPEVAS